MNADERRRLALAFSLALGGHLVLLLLLSLLLTKTQQAQASESSLLDAFPGDEITLVFQESPLVPPPLNPEPTPLIETSSESSSPSHTQTNQRRSFRETNAALAVETNPEEAQFIGEFAQKASQDEDAPTGDQPQSAQAGQLIPSPQSQEASPTPTPAFVEPELAQETIEDLDSTPETEPEPKKPEEKQPSLPEETQGQLTFKGQSSQAVASTAIGRYEQRIFELIKARWTRNLSSYREHIAPGLIIYRFSVQPDGRLKNQRRVKMTGASQLQWGHVVKDVNSVTLPPHPTDVRRELKGQALELTLTFNY